MDQMSDLDIALYGIIAVIGGGLVIWFILYTFSGQNKPPANLTEQSIARLQGLTGRATSDISEIAGTVFVNNEEFSAVTLNGVILKGTLVKIIESRGLTLTVERA